MMKQRHRLLMSSQFSLEDAFKTAAYIVGDGEDSLSGESSCSIEKSNLLANQKYYIFAYAGANLAIFTYYNGTITKICEYGVNWTPLYLLDQGALYLYAKGTSVYHILENGVNGMVALTFEQDMDAVFRNLLKDIVTGAEFYEHTEVICTLSDYVGEYMIFGCAAGFCVYKVNGSAFADLVAIFNHNLYLTNYNNLQVKLSKDVESIYTNLSGYTLLSTKG